MKCEHCSKDCVKRVAVRHKGKVLMVGTGCSKYFKKANKKHFFKSIVDFAREKRIREIFDLIEKMRKDYHIDTPKEEMIKEYKEGLQSILENFSNEITNEQAAKIILRSDYEYIIADLIADRFDLSDDYSEQIVEDKSIEIEECFNNKQKPEDVYKKIYMSWRGISVV